MSRLSRIDKWFLSRLRNIAQMKADALRCNLDQLNASALKSLKCGGFSDRQIARYTGSSELVVRRKRQQLGVTPFCKQIDTLAAEFPAETNYLYMTYHGEEHDVTGETGVENASALLPSFGKSVASSSSVATSMRSPRNSRLRG